MLGVVVAGDASAAVRIGNATRNSYYAAQMAEQERAAQVASTNDIARMSGAEMPNTYTRDADSVADAQLSACSRIYPNGEFLIDRPSAGLGSGGARTCVSVVELRGYQMGQNGGDVVLARANVAAGSSIKCNISEFPESSYTIDAQNIIFPADAEPTVEDVKKVMNQEQKQNAGLKIAAATLIGAVGGNIAGKNDAGKDSIIGTDKGKIQGTVVGALGGAAIGAGGAYAGFEGGNMIMSAGINAAGGGLIANMMAAGDSVLRIKECEVEGRLTSCLWGYLVTGPTLSGKDVLCVEGKQEQCNKYFIDLNDGETVMRCNENGKQCMTVANLVSINVKGSDKPLDQMERKDLDALKDKEVFHLEADEKETKQMKDGMGGSDSHKFALISSAKISEGPKTPALIADIDDTAFGRKSGFWVEWKGNHLGKEDFSIYYRNDKGGAEKEDKQPASALNDFYPMYVDAEGGGIIDLGNKARLKSTLIGAGAGGALGAFTAYQGAQDEIDNRWVSAVREYKDSLQKFYCVTGSRFLSYYNDVLYIPNMNE